MQEVFMSIRRRDLSSHALSSVEKDILRRFFFTYDIRKWAQLPDSEWPELLFQSDRVDLRDPPEFQVFSADPSYMPLAWDGIEDEFTEMMSFYRSLPPDFKEF